MEIRRFFVQPSDINGDLIALSGDEFLHMTRVLRYKVGYKAVILANDGKERLCTVSRIGDGQAELVVDSVREVDKKSVNLTLYAGLLKNNKLDFVIQKAVELGVDKVVPFVSANCAESKFSSERGARIALEAAKQCGSAYLSEVGDLSTFDSIAEEFCNYDSVLFAYECERKTSLAEAAKGKNVAIVVGPEGGFTREEAEKAGANGATLVTLGRRILRAETAAIVASALVLDSLGELRYE